MTVEQHYWQFKSHPNFALLHLALFMFNSCIPCNSSCQTCFGESSDQCLSCSLPKLLLGSTCVAECPNGMFHSQVTHTCESCQATCESCSGPTNSDCLSCKGMRFTCIKPIIQSSLFIDQQNLSCNILLFSKTMFYIIIIN